MAVDPFCPSCGAAQEATNVFCPKCGRKLPSSEPAAAAPVVTEKTTEPPKTAEPAAESLIRPEMLAQLHAEEAAIARAQKRRGLIGCTLVILLLFALIAFLARDAASDMPAFRSKTRLVRTPAIGIDE